MRNGIMLPKECIIHIYEFNPEHRQQWQQVMLELVIWHWTQHFLEIAFHAVVDVLFEEELV